MDLVLSNFFFVEQRGEEQGCVEEEDGGGGCTKLEVLGSLRRQTT